MKMLINDRYYIEKFLYFLRQKIRKKEKNILNRKCLYHNFKTLTNIKLIYDKVK